MSSMRSGAQAEESTASVGSAIATKGVYLGLAVAFALSLALATVVLAATLADDALGLGVGLLGGVVVVVVAFGSLAARPGAAQEKLGDVSAATTTDGGRGRYCWLASLGGALVLMLLLAMLLFAARADAQPRIKVSGCNVYATNRVDPIAFSQHLHHHFGNTTTTNHSTGESLVAANRTSCKTSWFTSAAWFPVARSVPLYPKNQVAVYYRAPGDQRQVRTIPTGLGIIAHDAQVNSGGDSATVKFPDCWNQGRLRPANMVMSRNGVCPSTHPYRIPRISYLIRYGGKITRQTPVSTGVDSWAPFGSAMHADYLAANRPVFNDRLLELCLRNAPDSVTVAHPDCGEGP